MSPNNRIFALVAVLALLSVPAANATIAAAASFDEKVDNATGIILGKCIKSESRFDPSGRWILTYSTFQVEQSLKGAAGATVTVVTPGGTVGGLHQSSIGVPAFREGEENVVFLKDSSYGPTVLYFDQGAYNVTSENGEKVVGPVPSSLVKIDEQRGVAVPSESPRLLRDFDGNVRSSMRGSADRAKMAALQAKAQKQKSLGDVLTHNWWIVAIALLGLALTGWQLVRRS